MDTSDKPPADDLLPSIFSLSPSKSCDSLDVDELILIDSTILTQDPDWNPGLQLLTDPFPESITSLSHDEDSELQQCARLCQHTVTFEEFDPMEQPGHIEQVAMEMLETTEQGHTEMLHQRQQFEIVEHEQMKHERKDSVDNMEERESKQQVGEELLESQGKDQKVSKKIKEQDGEHLRPEKKIRMDQAVEDDVREPAERKEHDLMDVLAPMEHNHTEQIKCGEHLFSKEYEKVQELEAADQHKEHLQPLVSDNVEQLEVKPEEQQTSMHVVEHQLGSLQDHTQQPPCEPDGSEPCDMDLGDAAKDGSEVSSLEVPYSEELEKLFRTVEENPEEFTGWMYLLQHVEQQNLIEAARKAFDAFFSRYPYCYGYWNKYAEMEKKLTGTQKADEVYRRGLQAIPLSVDLWMHYIDFLKENTDSSDDTAVECIRNVFEHAVMAAGQDFRSDRLWESYISWETDLGNKAKVTTIYDRVLAIPTQLFSQHFQKFKEHVQNNLPKHFLSLEEFTRLRKELASVDGLSGEEISPSEDLPSGVEDLPDPAKRVTEVENMRHRVLETRQEVFSNNEHEVSKRWMFEDGLKRPYFHVKPLERSQLNTWREYLDFEMENGSPERVVVLFERCLVACALYEEFWIKFAHYMKRYGSESVRGVYRRACLTHLLKKPTIHMLWASLEEQQGNVEEARAILRSLDCAVPGLISVRLRRVNLERRHGNLEEAESLLQEAVQTARNSSESSFYSIKLARLILKVGKSRQKARHVLQEALVKDESNPKLYMNLLELAYSGDVQEDEVQILSCLDMAITSSLTLESRLTFSLRKVEFLEDFGSNADKLVAACEEYQKLVNELELKKEAEKCAEEAESEKQSMDDLSVTSGYVTPETQSSQADYNYSWYQYSYQNAWSYGHYYPPPAM